VYYNIGISRYVLAVGMKENPCNSAQNDRSMSALDTFAKAKVDHAANPFTIVYSPKFGEFDGYVYYLKVVH
jgi:hypothetical protein